VIVARLWRYAFVDGWPFRRARSEGKLMKALSLQSFIGARLRSSAIVTALVPSSNILDDDARPERFPCIIVRHSQPTSFDRIELNIWSKASGFAEVREISAAIAHALETSPWQLVGPEPSHLRITTSLFLPRNDGAYSHGILSVEATI